jgi:hypothetical protein
VVWFARWTAKALHLSSAVQISLGCAVQLEFRRARVGGCAVVLRHRIALCTGLSVAEVEFEFVERSVGTESRLHSVISGPRLTGTARGGHCRVLVKNPRLLQIRRIRNQAVASEDNKQLHIERRLLAD